MKVDYGTSRHFCDDPACPDPVWKLSAESFTCVCCTVQRTSLVFFSSTSMFKSLKLH